MLRGCADSALLENPQTCGIPADGLRVDGLGVNDTVGTSVLRHSSDAY